MEAERLIRILQRFQKPENGLEKISLYELAPYAAGLQKAIDVINKLEKAEIDN